MIDQRPICQVCNHHHESAKLREIEKANGSRFAMLLCAPCTLLLAGVKPYGCLEDR